MNAHEGDLARIAAARDLDRQYGISTAEKRVSPSICPVASTGLITLPTSWTATKSCTRVS